MRKLFLALLFTVTLNAQQLGTDKAVKSNIPTFDEDDKLMLNALVTMGTQANKLCGDLPEAKAFTEYQKNLVARMELKYKGFTLNGVNLVEKK